jgi:glycosyltransferase involved in cell wall biosynthesis
VKISLYILARNEAANIVQCLAPLLDLFDDIVVVDDASTDGMADVIARKLGITPLRVDSAEYPCMGAVRNLAVTRTRHPWVLKLDADERLSRAHARQLLELPDLPDCAGYLCAWRTFVDGAVIEDYKLPLARRDCVESGLAHENLQQDMRRRGLQAQWLAGAQLLHYPDPALTTMKAVVRRKRLLAALQREPAWLRHHWFLGYMDYLAGDHAAARQWLATVAGARPREFPVECLNSHMLLADLAARSGDVEAGVAILQSAREFHAQQREDFEVRVNFRIEGWLEQALRDATAGNLDAIRAYAFAR